MRSSDSWVRAARTDQLRTFYLAAPATINMRPFEAPSRIGLIAEYAGELYQACARSELSNAMTTIPLGGAPPSRVSVLPPRTTKWPLKGTRVSEAFAPYSFMASGSVIASASPIT